MIAADPRRSSATGPSWQSLVSRELKARYRGSVLGFFWSFVNPLLLLLTYTLVFSVDPAEPPAGHPALLPVPLLRDPALDVVLRLARRGLVRPHLEREPHQEGPLPGRGPPRRSPSSRTSSTSCSACRSCSSFLAWKGRLAWTAVLLPLPILVQLVLTLGLALFLSALTVHFRDLPEHPDPRASPVVLRDAGDLQLRRDPRGVAPAPGAAAQPDDPHHGHLPADAVPRPRRPLARAPPRASSSGWSPSPSAPSSSTACATPSRRKCDGARHRGEGRRQGLPSLPPPQPVQDPEERAPHREPPFGPASRRDLHRARRRLLRGAARLDLRGHRRERLGQVHPPEAGGRHHQAHPRLPGRGRARLRAHRARGRVPPRDLGPRERLHQRDHAGAHPQGGRTPLRRDRRVRGDARLHRRAGEDVLLGHVHAPRLRGGDPRRPRRAPHRRGAGGGRRGLHPQVPRQDRGVPPPRQDHPLRDPQPRPRREDVRRRPVAPARRDRRPRRPQAGGGRLPHLRGGRGGRAAQVEPGRRGRGAGALPGPPPRPRPSRPRRRPSPADTAPGAGAAARSRSARRASWTRGSASVTSSCPARP